jgi:phosphoserine phosphatase RsbU/P
MKIRTRLLLILLGTALTPLLFTSLMHEFSTQVARRKLSQITQETLDKTARKGLQEHLHGHVDVLVSNKQLVQALLERQAREIELALTTPSSSSSGLHPDTLGFDPNLIVMGEDMHPVFQDSNDPNILALNVDYQRQSYFLDIQTDANEYSHSLHALNRLTNIYHRTYTQAPQGTLWIVTRLKNGLITRYPAGGETSFKPRLPRGRSEGSPRTPPKGFAPDPKPPKRGFNRQGGRRDPLLFEPTTQQIVVTRSVPIRTAKGEQLGMTTLVRTLPEIFAAMALPERWGTDTQRMIIEIDPNHAQASDAQIILHDHVKDKRRRGRRRIDPGRLGSSDVGAFQLMTQDIIRGQAGVQLMEYNKKPHIWAYHPIDVENVAALLLVPYDRVTELAKNLETTFIKESLFWLEITSGLFVLTAILATFMAFKKAKMITRPIGALIDGAERLAQGDYQAQVNIQTGDELEHLGDIFNQTGPKLLEHQAMKHALELARAVQQSLLPKQTPRMSGFDIAGQCLFCDETGGDCYDFIDLSDTPTDKCGILLGDVSGHGISAAMLMASIRGYLQAETKHHGDNLVSLLAHLNQQIINDTEDERFATLFYGVLDNASRSLTWSSAGHDPALWYQAQNMHIEELPNTGMLLGVLEDANIGQADPIIMAINDVLVIGTDGIWEARNDRNELYGKQRLHQIIRDHAHCSAEAISTYILDSVTDFIGHAPRTDDITMVVVKTK